MSKRFGRNQKRLMLKRIKELKQAIERSYRAGYIGGYSDGHYDASRNHDAQPIKFDD